MSSYFSKTRLLVHPLSNNAAMPRFNSDSFTMSGASRIDDEGKLSTLLKLTSGQNTELSEIPHHGTLVPPIGLTGKVGSMSQKNLHGSVLQSHSTSSLMSPREAQKKLKLSPSYINPSKKTESIKLEDFIVYCKSKNVALNENEQRFYNVSLAKRNHRIWKYFINKHFESDSKDIIDDIDDYLYSDQRSLEKENPKNYIP